MRTGADAGQVADRFDTYRESMHKAIQRFVAQSATIEAIEASTRHRVEEDRAVAVPVAGTMTPFDYDLGKALGENHAYRLASSRRDSARRAAVMWAVAAQVEAARR